MSHSLIRVIQAKFPNVQVSAIGDGDTYAELVWEGGETLPSEAEISAAKKELLQEETWLQIKTERDRRKAAGIKVGDNWFHSDDTSRIQQIALTMLGASMPSGIMWKTMTGSFVEMSASLAQSIFQTNISYDKTNFAIAEQHRQNMMKLEDPTTYNYSSGWLQTFEEANPTLKTSLS